MRRPFTLAGLMLSLWFDGGYGFGGGELTSAIAILTTLYKGYMPPRRLFIVDVNRDRLAAAVLGRLLKLLFRPTLHPIPHAVLFGEVSPRAAYTKEWEVMPQLLVGRIST